MSYVIILFKIITSDAARGPETHHQKLKTYLFLYPTAIQAAYVFKKQVSVRQ